MAILILLSVCCFMGWIMGTFQFCFWVSDDKPGGNVWGFVLWVFLAFLPVAVALQLAVASRS